MVYILHFVYTLYSGYANPKKSRWKVRIYTDEKLGFLKLK